MEKKSPPFPWSDNARLRWRQLWQVPTFFLGLTVFVGTLLARPYLQSLWAAGERELKAAREILQRSEGDPGEVIELARQFLENPKRIKDHDGEAYFLLGSAEASLAKRQPPERAAETWGRARQHLTTALRIGAPEQDQGILSYRLAVAGYYAHEDPHNVVVALERSLPHADDNVEAYQLLTQVNLRLPKPNYEAALRANEELRQLPLLGEKVLAPARLLGGEILLRLKRGQEARSVLARIGNGAAKEVRVQARVLRAQIHQAEKNWTEALQLWNEVAQDAPASFDVGPVYFQLATCQLRLNDPEEAERSWRKCIERGSPASANAARFALADLLLTSGSAKDALPLLVQALKKLKGSRHWDATHVPLNQARTTLERGILHHLRISAHTGALTLAQQYEKLAEPGLAQFYQGQVKQVWAESLTSRAGADAQEKRKLLFREAGQAYDVAADLTPNVKAIPDWLWLSSYCYEQGQNPAQVVVVLERFLQREPQSKRSGEAYYRLGEAHRDLNNDKPAKIAYAKCLQFQSRFAYRSRFQLSRLEHEQGNTGSAAEILEHNIKQLRQNPDSEALEGSLFLLGKILHQRKKYNLAKLHLKDALSKFPRSEWAQRGRFELAESTHREAFRELALSPPDGDQKHRYEHFHGQFREALADAAALYRELRLTLSQDRGTVEPLTESEEIHAVFMEPYCLFYRGDYKQALDRYEALAKRFEGRPEHLRALGESVRCFIGLNDTAGFRQRVADVRAALKDQDPSVRAAWEKWLKDAGKELKIQPDDAG